MTVQLHLLKHRGPYIDMVDSGETPARIARVAFVVGDASLVLNEYNAICTAIRSQGHQVRCFATAVTRDVAASLDQQGIFCTEFAMVPETFALFPQRKAIADLAALLDEWKPTNVVAIGGAQLVHGILAARKLDKPHLSAVIELLPELNDAAQIGQRAGGPSLRRFKRALGDAHNIVCLNAATMKSLVRFGISDDLSKVRLLPRCGVDLSAFDETDVRETSDGVVFQLSCPLTKSNGVIAFCEAAALVKRDTPNATFILSGPPSNPDDVISLEALEPFANIVSYAGSTAQANEDLAHCHVFVCLACDEALSFRAMQALAIGRPLIVPYTASGLELVDERVNGCLVDPDNVEQVAEAMRSFVRRPDLVPSMGRASRRKAEHRLDQGKAVRSLIRSLQLDA